MSTAEQIRESAGRSFRRAGAAGVAGVALALFAVSFDLSGNRSLDAEADSLQQESRALSRRLRQPAAHRLLPAPPELVGQQSRQIAERDPDPGGARDPFQESHVGPVSPQPVHARKHASNRIRPQSFRCKAHKGAA